MATRAHAVVQTVEDPATRITPDVIEEILLRLPIANPASGQCLHISKPDGILLYDFHYLYSFGFHPVTGEYKILHFLREPQHYKSGRPFHFDTIQVYTLGEDKWKGIRTPRKCCMVNLGVVNVDGAMYWLTEDEGTSCGMSLVSFDLREETFTSIQLPPLTEVKETASCAPPAFACYIAEIDNTVCTVAIPYHSHVPRWRRYNAELCGRMDIWSLESLVKHKWFLKYSIQSPTVPRYVPQPCFIHRDKIILQDRNGSAWYHDLAGKNVQLEQREEAKLLDIGAYRFYETQSYFYKETLVPLSKYSCDSSASLGYIVFTMVSEETKPKRLKEEECTINRLPHDCIERIFVGLSVSTLLKCSGVCKQWYKLIRDPHFIAGHLERAPRCALLFFPQESVSGKRYPSDVIIFDEVWSQSTLAVPVIGPDDFLCGTCNGLLCLYTKTSKIKIANLATGECLHLDKPIKNLKGDHFSFYRFGFHPVTKEYKVIHFHDEHQNYSQGTFNVIQVYTFGSEKWRDVRTSEALSLSCVKDYGVVSVDGAMFWLTEDSDARWKHAVISFDLSEETFTRIQLPTAALGSSNSHRYWISEIDGKICIATGEVIRHRPKMLSGDLQIWMLDSKVEQKWSLMYNLPYARNYLPGPHFVHSDKILMQSRICDLYSYELFGKNHTTKLSDRVKLLDFSPRKPDNMQCYICVKSLVQLNAYKKVGIMHGMKTTGGLGIEEVAAMEA
ncbi:hypothetical protein PR202_ga15518 [Eleusine coracana subsp. coracana]|uniref:F-box domain-containing protein n=1 Tax=Eleusine coracana subsp. coracana TaxID=191504 RepID=A0AAV5CJ77_ELECO|nr:hypothetical protein PR202_ga15518 [Eleusine coracana subsp. coracana]